MTSNINNLFDKISNDFNTDFLDTASPFIRKAFKDTSEEFKDGKNGNITLLNLIYNYFNGILPIPLYISGPISLTYQKSKKYDMKVYIFGEEHGIDNNCSQLKKINYMDISKYLQKLFLNSDKFIDFYLEETMFNTYKPGTKQKDFMSMLRHDFYNCLNPAKRSKCIFKTVRSHFIDSRITESGKTQIPTTDIEKVVMYLLGETSNKPINTLYLLNEIASLDSFEEIATYIIDIASNTPIIKKELDRCTLDKELVLSIFHDIIIQQYQSDITIDDVKLLSEKTIGNTEKAEILTVIQSPIVDIYTISRMFKRFKKSENFPDKQRNIVYYAGSSHADMIRNFLYRLDFEEKFARYSDPNQSTRCLNMIGMSLDFK